MRNITLKIANRSIIAFLFLCAIFVFANILPVQSVFAGSGDNVSGFAWTANIGWISFNNTNTGGPHSYGVNINTSNGLMSGYAYSEHLGYITFNDSELAGCPIAPCEARVATVPTSGQYPISGWARACSVFVAGCSGALKPASELGGWDGWIRLRNDGGAFPYGWYIQYSGGTGYFHGYAFGATNTGDRDTEGVIGWISANCHEGSSSGGSICSDNGLPGNHSDYAVQTSVQFAPEAKMACDPTKVSDTDPSVPCPGGTCDCDAAGNCGTANWRVFIPNTSCATCNYTIRNLSTGNITRSTWTFNGTDYVFDETGGSKTGFTFPIMNMAPGNYPITLTVTDGTNSDTTDPRIIEIRSDVQVKPMCSFDDPEDPDNPGGVWYDCNDPVFKSKIQKDEKVYLRNDSVPSTGASSLTGAWDIHTWTTVIGDGLEYNFTDSTASPLTAPDNAFVAGKKNSISLSVTDNNAFPRTCTKTIGEFKSKALPEWEEVNPIGYMWNNFVANIAKFFAAI